MDALSNAESDISFAVRRLENVFNKKNDESVQYGDSHIPNPVKMIRRLTALELAMGQLRKDCETISKKRKDIVKSVVSKQNDNVENVQKLLQDTAPVSSERHSSRRTSVDEQNWNDLTSDLSEQARLLTAADNF